MSIAEQVEELLGLVFEPQTLRARAFCVHQSAGTCPRINNGDVALFKNFSLGKAEGSTAGFSQFTARPATRESCNYDFGL
jgi:hypothetical protein